MSGLHVDEQRAADAVTGIHVVFVHGVMDRSTGFDRVRGLLGDVTTVAYDRRGYARSKGVPAVAATFADQCNDLRSVLDGRPTVVLVGHSYGAVVAMGVAADDQVSGQIVGLVAFEPPMSWTDWWPSSAGGSTLAVADLSGTAAATEAFMRRIVGEQRWERLPEVTKDDRRAEGDALVADLRSLRGGPAPFSAARCAVPAVLACGSDSLEHHRRATAWFAAALPQGRFATIDGAGHGAHTSHPGAFADLVRCAMARSLSDPGPNEPESGRNTKR